MDQCGEILTSRTGKISYKKDVSYDNNERCVWIIHEDVMREGEIKVQLTKDGFEQYYDYVTLASLDLAETKL